VRRSRSGSAFAAPSIVARVSFCVVPVIVGSLIAAWRVAHRRAHSNGVRPANVISAALPDASIIVTGSALIAVV
jgi:hypothetical protein